MNFIYIYLGVVLQGHIYVPMNYSLSTSMDGSLRAHGGPAVCFPATCLLWSKLWTATPFQFNCIAASS